MSQAHTQETPYDDSLARPLPVRMLKETRHICAFFHSKEEQNKVLMPFFKEGFERGEKLFHVVDGRHRDAHLCACQDGGIDLETCATTDQLEVLYVGGSLSAGRPLRRGSMIRILTEVLESNRGGPADAADGQHGMGSRNGSRGHRHR